MRKTTALDLLIVAVILFLGLYCYTVSANQCLEKYSRSAFPHWHDIDGDGLNAREQAIASQLVKSPYTGHPIGRIEDGKVVSGIIRDPLTGRILKIGVDPIDGDHRLSLAEAFRRGARCWTPEMRRQFANDPANVVATAARTNRQKGQRNTFQWIPPSIGDCREWLGNIGLLVTKYPLIVTDKELATFQRMRGVCNSWVDGIRLDKAVEAIGNGWLDKARADDG